MQQQPIRIVMTDLDGTFIRNVFEPIEENVRAMERCKAAGVPVCAVTARNYNCAERVFRRANFTDYVVTNNGSSIQDAKTGENLWENVIPDAWLRAALELCVRLNVPFQVHDSYTALHYGPTKSDEESYLDRENRLETDPRFHTVVEDAQDIDEILTRMNGHTQLIRIKGDGELPSWFYTELIRCGDFTLTSSQPNPGQMEIMAAGSGKRAGAQQLARLLHIPRENVMACGDHYNDVGMIEWAGIGVAMGNAQPRVKQLADYVAPVYTEGGVADAMERFVLAQRA